MTDGHDDDHGAGIEREGTQTHLSWRVKQQADIGTVKQRASLDWKSDGAPVQAEAGILTQEDVKERSPSRLREVRVKRDPEARRRPLLTDGYGHVQNASYGGDDVTEVCDFVQHRGGPQLHCASVLSGVEGRGEDDRSGLGVRVSQLPNEVCPGTVWEPEIEDHHIGSGKHVARLAQRRCFSHDLEVGIGPELRSQCRANGRAVFHE
jgi:hypothetical protein